MNTLTGSILAAMAMLSLAATLVARRSRRRAVALRTVVAGALSLNSLAVLACIAMPLFHLAAPMLVLAEGTAETSAAGISGAPLAAAVATGLACIGAGIAVAVAGAAAIGGITEKPENFGRALIFVGLAEGIAIYGLIISVMILGG